MLVPEWILVRRWLLLLQMLLLPLVFALEDDFSFDDSRTDASRYVYEPNSALCLGVACGVRSACVLRLVAHEGVALRDVPPPVALCAPKAVALSLAADVSEIEDDVFLEPNGAIGANGPDRTNDVLQRLRDDRTSDDDLDDGQRSKCASCAASTRGGAVCGSDNRRYASLCALDLSNCRRRTKVAPTCRPPCPCRTRGNSVDGKDPDVGAAVTNELSQGRNGARCVRGVMGRCLRRAQRANGASGASGANGANGAKGAGPVPRLVRCSCAKEAQRVCGKQDSRRLLPGDLEALCDPQPLIPARDDDEDAREGSGDDSPY